MGQEDGYMWPVDDHREPEEQASELNELLCVLDRINGLCIGEIAMGYKVDANQIGEMIYEATGMNAEELTRHCKELHT